MRCLLTLSIGIWSLVASAAVTIEKGTTFTRPAKTTMAPMSTSGITYAGGNTFYAVADDRGDLMTNEGGLYTYTINLSSDGKTITSATSTLTNQVVKLENGYDQEGIAYDPATGDVWVSDEVRKSIRRYNPKTGKLLETLDYPTILKNNAVGNFAVEGLTISGDGLTMWFANEEALTCDGERSSYTSGTDCRLYKFVRQTVHEKFKPAGQFVYRTENWKYAQDVKSKARRGIAGLCALPDGSLLILERDLSFANALYGYLGYYVYRVATPEWATDVTSVASLKTDTTWTAVSKTLLVSDSKSLFSFGNFEGICLGPRLSDGNTSILLISDAGDGYSEPMIQPLVLKGLNISTVNFTAPTTGVSSPVGSNYRYLDGTKINVTLSGPTIDPQAYTNDGAVVTSAIWSTGTNMGIGPVASFTVSGGDKTLVWATADTIAKTGLLDRDSFEPYAAGTVEPGNWTGDCEVQALTYTPPAVGYPMGRETHEKVLDIDGEAIRPISTFADGDKLDFMLMTQRPAEPLEPIDNVRIAVAMTSEGYLAVWNRVGEDCAWTQMDETVYPDGQWIRVTIQIKGSLASVFVDGAKKGDYHLATEGVVSELVLTGTKADDFMVTTPDYVTEGIVFAEETVSDDPGKNGIPFAWLDQLGWPHDPDQAAAKVKVPGYSLKDLYISGVDPQGTEPLKIKSLSVGADGKIHLVINGYRGNDGEGYAIRYATTIEGLFKARSSEEASGEFDGDLSTHTTTWEGTLKSADASSGFYRVEAR